MYVQYIYNVCFININTYVPGVIIITTPASPLPIELVATTENVYLVIEVKLVIVYCLAIVEKIVGHATSPEHDTV